MTMMFVLEVEGLSLEAAAPLLSFRSGILFTIYSCLLSQSPFRVPSRFD